MEECEILDSEGPELQELMSQDDDDEVEELHNSLREVVQDQSVKPKFQCLMVDASFSMVTVQSEDSGIVWETASSRCSTPWASETSSTSEAYSMDGSGAAGKITIVFDEDKIVRKRTRSGRSSRLGDRLSRPGSSRSASALGVERPEMAEISLPNVKLDKTETEPDLEEIRNKDQQLFSLISEGYEILNIRVPSKLPTVDEEESTELQDNLSYLDQTPKIRSGNRNDWSLEANPALPKEGELLDDQKTLKRDSSADTPSQKESPGDIDYFEKFTLVDVVVPGERAPESQEDAEQPQAKHNAEEQKPAKEADRNSPSASDDSFVFVTDVDIAGEHLDEVFYGAGASADALQQRGEDEADSGTRRRRPSHRSLMENGSRLFGAEDTVLTPIFLSPGPPKIIDQILLDEPTAMSFMYSDLYEDAVGERRKSDEERSEAESMASEKTYQRRLSDSDEADGYLEKFILKDETSTVEVQPDPVEETREGRMMWSQSKFDMTGCLTRVTTEDDEDKSKTEDPEPREVSVGDASDNSQSATSTGRREIITEPKKEMKEIQVSTVTEGEAAREASHNSTEASTLREDQMEVQGVKRGGKSEAPVSSIDKPLNDTQKADGKVEKAEESTEHPAEVAAETTSVVETEQPRGAQMVLNAAGETSVAAPVSSEAPHITDISLSNEAARDTETTASHGKDFTEAAAEASAAAKQMETSAEISVRDKNEAAEVVPGDVLSFEVIAECDSAVQAIVEVIEKTVDETEIRTEVQIDLQEAISVETTADEPGVLAEAAAVEGKSPTLITEGYQETEVEAEILNEVTESAMLVKKDSDKWQILNSESMQHQQEEPVTDSEIINKATEDTGNVTQEKVHMDDELVLLVPKGQAVEMDIEISQLSQKTTSGPEAVSEPDRLTAPETSTRCHESLRAPTDQTGTRPRLEVTPDAVLKEDTLSIHQADSGFAPPAAEEGACADTPKARSDFEEVEGDFLSPRSLTPQEDLSESHSEDRKSGEADAEQKAEIHNEGDAPETRFVTQHSGKEIDEHREDVEPKMEPDQVAAEATEVSADGLEYEIISKQDAEGMPEPDTQRNVEEPILECGQERDERMEMEEEEEEEKVLDDEFIEADYEIIDAEEESQARLAAELQQMDRFCVTCGCLLSEDDCVSGEHHHHEVAALDQAYEAIKEKLSDWISELQGRSENIEDLVSELELAYNSVEDQCVESEAAMQAQNEETKALVMEQYNDMSVSMEEEKKAKLEQLYDQIVALQEGIDTAKATLETTAREAETDARSPEDINARIKATLDSAMSLELGPKGLLVFEDYARGNGSSSHLAQRKGIPVPQRPTLQPQETGLATSTSVTVYWKVNPGDIIDCFQVYCMEDPQGASTAVSEEYRVTVKESYCALEELEPDKTYKVWVMAVNYTGCSLPSERLSFTTAPSVPAIETERCTVTWDSATLRWSSAHQTPEQSYTLEYCRQYELEGEGLRSISGIKSCEQRVLLQPNESYLFYIKAVNACGASEQSEAALISTKGTRFHLLKASAHPALELSADRTVVHYDAPSADNQCPSILGELLPARGRYYWETLVSGSTAYRLGAAYAAADGNSPLGENHLSWCLRCIPTPSGCRYQLLHKDILSSMFVMEVPERVGTLLDHQLGRLSFYNARSGQLLGTFCQQFTRLCHPALALEGPGSLEVRMVPEVPEFTKHS